MQRLPWLVRFLVALLLCVTIGSIDWWTGYYVSVFAFYAVPIAFGVQTLGTRGGFAVYAVTAVCCYVARHTMSNRPAIGGGVDAWNTLMRLLTLFFFYLGASAMRFRFEAMKTRMRVLSGLLPLCSCCARIRDEYGHWEELESYLREHTEADIERKLCPDCSKRLSAGNRSPAPVSES